MCFHDIFFYKGGTDRQTSTNIKIEGGLAFSETAEQRRLLTNLIFENREQLTLCFPIQLATNNRDFHFRNNRI